MPVLPLPDLEFALTVADHHDDVLDLHDPVVHRRAQVLTGAFDRSGIRIGDGDQVAHAGEPTTPASGEMLSGMASELTRRETPQWS